MADIDQININGGKEKPTKDGKVRAFRERSGYEEKGLRDKDFPSSLLKMGLKMDVSKARASKERDKVNILTLMQNGLLGHLPSKFLRVQIDCGEQSIFIMQELATEIPVWKEEFGFWWLYMFEDAWHFSREREKVGIGNVGFTDHQSSS